MVEPERQKSRAAEHVDRRAPAIILARPQLGENIGTAARAMLNCGLSELRLVAPRDGWPNVKALNASSGAHEVLSGVRVFDSVAEAAADLTLIHATTARARELAKPVVTPRQAVRDMRRAIGRGARAGVLFGPERTGLNNDELVLADAIIRAPTNPAFSSLNLAQAVLIVAYEWCAGVAEEPEPALPLGQTRWATKAEALSLFECLERALDAREFFPTPEMRPKMVRNMRTMLERMGLTHQDVQSLYGIVRSLSEDEPVAPPGRGRTRPQGTD